MMRTGRRLSITLTSLLALGFLASCTVSNTSGLPTPLPPGYLPTAIALTVQAGQTAQPAFPSPSEPLPTEPENSGETTQPAITAAPQDTASPPGPTGTAAPVTLPAPPTATPIPGIPYATIQIYRPGDLSKVVSPLHVTGYTDQGTAKTLRVELWGESGNLLVRKVDTFSTFPWRFANINTKLDFEIHSAAETGRVVVSLEDDRGRIVALNSVDVILMSVGEADVNPASAVSQAIVIQQPRAKALVQGSKLLVSGLVRPGAQSPLMAQLITAEKKVVGMRLAGVTPDPSGGYGTFAAEVPYQVERMTNALLVVYEGGEDSSTWLHLSSLEVVLSP